MYTSRLRAKADHWQWNTLWQLFHLQLWVVMLALYCHQAGLNEHSQSDLEWERVGYHQMAHHLTHQTIQYTSILRLDRAVSCYTQEETVRCREDGLRSRRYATVLLTIHNQHDNIARSTQRIQSRLCMKLDNKFSILLPWHCQSVPLSQTKSCATWYTASSTAEIKLHLWISTRQLEVEISLSDIIRLQS